MPDLRKAVLEMGALHRRPQPTIEAAGLLLRPWRTEDAPVLLRAYCDPEIRRWQMRSMDGREARHWIDTRNEMWIKEGEMPVGRICAQALDLRDGCAGVAYWVLAESRGRRVATRALRTIADWLFSEVGLRRLELEHSTANPASCRAALNAGFAVEGIKRGALLHEDGWHDLHLHGRLRDDPDRSRRPGCSERGDDEPRV